MSTTSEHAVVRLDHRYADALPELMLPVAPAAVAAAVPAPELLVLDEQLAAELGLDAGWLRSDAGTGLLTGTALPPGSQPVAQAYAGHQFGSWNPRLGDGRAALLGELVAPDGRVLDLHVKGSGRTAFSRGGDGLAAVGPMLREHVVSTSLIAQGIPTTRVLAVSATGRTVHRERPLPGAVLTRVAASHVRVGTVELTRGLGDPGLLRRLADHAVERLHPSAAAAPHRYRALYDAVVAVQAELIARWMLAGFVHGVMNTDNMTLSGETIDLGPCAFLDGYRPGAVFSSIDEFGRYAYDQQPTIAAWNLARLGEALLPLLVDEPGSGAGDGDDAAVAAAQQVLATFPDRYRSSRRALVRRKLGLGPLVGDAEIDALERDLVALLQATQADWTGSFRALGAAAAGDDAALEQRVALGPELRSWLAAWRSHDPQRAVADAVNPVVIPRNHLVEEALDAATAGDLRPVEQLVAALRRPYEALPGAERYALPAPDGFDAGFRTSCGT